MKTSRKHARIALIAVAALMLLPLLALASPSPQPSDGTTSHSTKPASGQVAGYPASGRGGVPRDALRHQRDLTRHARAVWGMGAPVATFAAQIHQESRWRVDAVSVAGAQGMAQFMPSTATWISGAYKMGEAQPYNTGWALRALVTYDRHLWERVSAGDECSRMAMTLSAYNGGLGWIARDQKLASAKGADQQTWFGQVEKFNAGRSAASFTENRGYPQRILFRLQQIYAAWGGVITCA